MAHLDALGKEVGDFKNDLSLHDCGHRRGRGLGEGECIECLVGEIYGGLYGTRWVGRLSFDEGTVPGQRHVLHRRWSPSAQQDAAFSAKSAEIYSRPPQRGAFHLCHSETCRRQQDTSEHPACHVACSYSSPVNACRTPVKGSLQPRHCWGTTQDGYTTGIQPLAWCLWLCG